MKKMLNVGVAALFLALTCGYACGDELDGADVIDAASAELVQPEDGLSDGEEGDACYLIDCSDAAYSCCGGDSCGGKSCVKVDD